MTPRDATGRKVLVTVLLGTFTVSLNNSALNLAIPELMRIFDASAVRVSWVMTLFLICMGMTMPVTGFLADRFGAKRIYLLGVWLFLAGSLAGAASETLLTVILARGMQGSAGGLMIPLSLSLIFRAFPAHRRGRVTGIWGVAVMIAPAIGPSVGGLLLEVSRWQALFLMNLPFAVLALACGHRYLSDATPDATRRFDLPGFGLVTLGVGSVLFALGTASTLEALLTPLRLFPLGLGTLMLVVFVRVELRVTHPLLDLRIFAVRNYTLSVLIACAQAIGTFGCLLLIPLWMLHVQGHDALTTGMVFLPSALAAAGAVAWAGRLIDRRSPRWVIAGGLLMTVASLAGLAGLDAAAPLWAIVMLMVLRGIGLGFSYLPVTTVGLNALADDRVAQASAMNNVSRRVTSSLGVVALSLYYELRTSQQHLQGVSMTHASMTALGEAFLVLALLILAVTPLALSLHASSREAASSRGRRRDADARVSQGMAGFRQEK